MSPQSERYGPWCQCGHHVTDHPGNYNGSEACKHCPCPRYRLRAAAGGDA